MQIADPPVAQFQEIFDLHHRHFGRIAQLGRHLPRMPRQQFQTAFQVGVQIIGEIGALGSEQDAAGNALAEQFLRDLLFRPRPDAFDRDFSSVRGRQFGKRIEQDPDESGIFQTGNRPVQQPDLIGFFSRLDPESAAFGIDPDQSVLFQLTQRMSHDRLSGSGLFPDRPDPRQFPAVRQGQQHIQQMLIIR